MVVLSFVLYGNSIQNNYNIDDDYVVSNNAYVQRGVAGIPDILTHPYSVRGNIVLDYRPVILVSYALEYQVFKANPHVSHFINILLYALCLIVMYNVLITVFRLDAVHPFLPLLITLFYAIHPIHTEVVDSIKNRDELFGLLFGLLFLKNGYYFFSKSEKRVKYALLTILFFVLTLFSKIIGILYILVLFFVLLYNKLLKWNKYNYLFIFACFVIWLFTMSKVFSGLKRDTLFLENSLVGNPSLLIQIATALKISFYHLKMLIISFPFRFYYGYNLFPINHVYDPIVIISLIIHGALLVFGIKQFRKKDPTGLFILCYLGCLLLYSNFPIPYTGMFSERALFLSSLWFIGSVFLMINKCLEYYKFLEKKPNIKYLLVFFLVIPFVLYSLQTMRRNLNWKDTITLMSHDMPYLENSVLANFIYANNLNLESANTEDSVYSNKLSKRSVLYFQKAIALYPYHAEFHYKVAQVLQYKLKDYETAEIYYKNSLKLDSNYLDVNFQLGKIYFDKKDYKTSFENFSKSYNKNPGDSLTLYYLSENANAVGDLETVYNANKEFTRLYPNVIYPYMNLGVCYSKMMKDDSAVIYFEKAIELGERNPQLLNQMAIFYNGKKNTEKMNYFLSLLPRK